MNFSRAPDRQPDTRIKWRSKISNRSLALSYSPAHNFIYSLWEPRGVVPGSACDMVCHSKSNTRQLSSSKTGCLYHVENDHLSWAVALILTSSTLTTTLAIVHHSWPKAKKKKKGQKVFSMKALARRWFFINFATDMSVSYTLYTSVRGVYT
jgi:hypothetical protein